MAGLARKGAERCATEQVALKDEDDDENGREIDRSDRSEDAPINADVRADDPDHCDWNSTSVLAGEEKAEQEIVPGKDESNHRRSGNAGADLRQTDFPKDREMRTAVEPGRLLDFAVELVEKASQHPYRERQVERRIDQDDAEIGAAKAGQPKQQVKGNDQRQRRHHAQSKNVEHIIVASRRAQPREPVGGERPEGQGQSDADAGNEDGVEDVALE